MFEHVEHLQRRDALRVGAQRVDRHAAIIGAVRLHPFAVHRLQIGFAQPAADAPEIGVDRVGDRPVVEGVAAALGDHPIGAREIGIAEYAAGLRADAVRRIGFEGVGGFADLRAALLEDRHVVADVIGNHVRHGHAVLGIVDRRLQHFRPRQFAVALVQRPPGIERAGRRYRDCAQRRNRSLHRMLADRIEA